MTLNLRVLVDSIVGTSLDLISRATVKSVIVSSKVKAAILRLGAACASTPWSSGASSSLEMALVNPTVAFRTHDSETRMSSVCTLRMFSSLGTARVPALNLDKQSYELLGSSKQSSASSLLHKIKNGRNEDQEALCKGDLRPAKRQKLVNASGQSEVASAEPLPDAKSCALGGKKLESMHNATEEAPSISDVFNGRASIQTEQKEKNYPPLKLCCPTKPMFILSKKLILAAAALC